MRNAELFQMRALRQRDGSVYHAKKSEKRIAFIWDIEPSPVSTKKLVSVDI